MPIILEEKGGYRIGLDYEQGPEKPAYYWFIEKLVTWRTDEWPGATTHMERQSWETVDTLGTYYGYEQAEEAAREAFADFQNQGGVSGNAAEFVDRNDNQIRPVTAGIAVVVPARDEGTALGDSLMSLAAQTLRPDTITVVVNNSTDDTEAVARAFAALPGVPPTDVLVMPGVNRFKKAGALNYGIRHLIGWRRHLEDGQPLPADIRYLLTMDGDTDLDPRFLERARNVLDADPGLGGVSAACLGKQLRGVTWWSRLLLLVQRVEYGRFTATRLRRNVHTMSGAGSFYRASALNELLGLRRNVFDERTSNLVEDYETTLALKQAGWRITSNQQCTAYTDLMPTMRMLLAQRERWVRGTVDEWRRYGWCKATWLSIASMIAGIAGTGYASVWVGVTVAGAAAHGWTVDPRYLLLAVFWSAYQGWAVQHMGWKVVLFEMALLPEAAFNVIRSYWLFTAIVKSYAGRAPAWS